MIQRARLRSLNAAEDDRFEPVCSRNLHQMRLSRLLQLGQEEAAAALGGAVHLKHL